MQDILEGLNEKQHEAVINTEGPCLVIAGAGSGKTKVLTHKIAYLVKEKQVKPWDILAITFTNKAANEMKERIVNLVGDDAKDIWMGTFHSICVRILRRFIDRIGFDSSFIIFDTSDQRTLIKGCLKDLSINDKLFTERSVLSEISNAKNEMLEPEEYKARINGDFRKEKIAIIYELYQKRLKENNAVDFDDIINYTIKILMENPDVLEYYSNKFKYVLVDEYQDTNKAQFTLVTLFASKNGNITVVGDNDQSIYGFRGSDITNILNFEKDFTGTKIIKLEQNYRCTGNILKAANAVIKNNEVKYKKELWTQNSDGNLPKVYQADNEYDEGSFIVEEIENLR
ncbi:MAG: UvrD-helicase domain-containing protein, partial [Clostridia bacterium]|nr:UvrD-helicase domain-containing protein [Clostridia bacterium]